MQILSMYAFYSYMFFNVLCFLCLYLSLLVFINSRLAPTSFSFKFHPFSKYCSRLAPVIRLVCLPAPPPPMRRNFCMYINNENFRRDKFSVTVGKELFSALQTFGQIIDRKFVTLKVFMINVVPSTLLGYFIFGKYKAS